MPTIWTKCPNCLRPIDTDYEVDGESVICPGCDSPVPVPQPRLMRVPNLIWVAGVLLALLPLSVTAAGMYYYTNWVLLGPGLFLSAVMLIPGIALVRGSFAGWLTILVVNIILLLGSIWITLMGLSLFAAMAPLAKPMLWFSLPIFLLAAALMFVLLTPTVRSWCRQ